MKILHFSLGPVQTFVAQSRRTRDLWAGSFLLSWLSGQAMKSVLDQGGSIVFPEVGTRDNPKDELLKAILGKGGHPHIGSIPNRFKAEVPSDFNPEQMTKEIQNHWESLADTVYKKFVVAVANDLDRETIVSKIWLRQIKSFWTINWVIGEDPGDRSDENWLDIRKNWRDHWPEAEAGDHCTMMGDYQEISGYVRAKDRKNQDEFWQRMQKSAPDDQLDLRDNERLCAIALVKRLFPRLGKDLHSKIGWIPGGKENAVGNWPSTTYMAVAPWLGSISEKEQHIDLLAAYLKDVKATVGENYFRKLASERAVNLTYLKPLATGHHRIPRSNGGSWALDDIDGDLLHFHALQNHRNTPLSEQPRSPNPKTDVDADSRRRVLDSLSNLYDALEKKPRSYYALLLMDGDRLGKMLHEENQTAVSRALLQFTRKVDDCVTKERHSGVTIYAGGDDVLALLPLDRAISCAQALREIFGDCFRQENIQATASCAVIFAHHQIPLRKVLHEAHFQLDDRAKDGNGRDSLAIAVLKPSGVTAQWVSVWNISAADSLQDLANRIRDNEYPRGFFHKLRDLYGFYETPDQQHLPDHIDVQKLMVAEYMQSRDRKTTLADAETAIDRLSTACTVHRRNEDRSAFTLDGGFIARFLAQDVD